MLLQIPQVEKDIMIARSHGKASKYLTMDIGPEMVGDLNSTDGPFDWTLTEEEEGNVKEILMLERFPAQGIP